MLDAREDLEVKVGDECGEIYRQGCIARCPERVVGGFAPRRHHHRFPQAFNRNCCLDGLSPPPLHSPIRPHHRRPLTFALSRNFLSFDSIHKLTSFSHANGSNFYENSRNLCLLLTIFLTTSLILSGDRLSRRIGLKTIHGSVNIF